MRSISEHKSSLRYRLKQQRNSLQEKRRRQYDQAIFLKLFSLSLLQEANAVFCFISSGTEVNTHAVMRQLLQNGKKLSVPKIIDSGTMIAVPFSNWDELETGQLGILTPVSSAPVNEKPDVCITPGLGFTENGLRIGFGRGYYDKWFSEHPVIQKIAMAYECQIIEEIPTNNMDVPVDLIVTEERIIEIKKS